MLLQILLVETTVFIIKANNLFPKKLSRNLDFHQFIIFSRKKDKFETALLRLHLYYDFDCSSQQTSAFVFAQQGPNVRPSESVPSLCKRAALAAPRVPGQQLPRHTGPGS